MKVPDWIRHHFPKPEALKEMHSILKGFRLHTVCDEARCPNIGECFNKGTATFLILGDICTRSCKFCAVKKGKPLPVDTDEPIKVSEAVRKLGLSHAVITSVTRDDLPDKGATQFSSVVKAIHSNGNNGITVELLLPLLPLEGLKKVITVHPDVINHNIETVERLYPEVRPGFRYFDSLNFLCKVKKFDSSIRTKSGLIVGLGETKDEVVKTMQDLRMQNVDILTIGQYLRPTGNHLPVARYVHPEEFWEYEKIGYSLGFKYIVAGPYVRSSYRAWEAFVKCQSS